MNNEAMSDWYDTPWEHSEEPMNKDRLQRIGEQLEPHQVTYESRGHRKTLGVCRELYDEVIRLRALR